MVVWTQGLGVNTGVRLKLCEAVDILQVRILARTNFSLRILLEVGGLTALLKSFASLALPFPQLSECLFFNPTLSSFRS